MATPLGAVTNLHVHVIPDIDYIRGTIMKLITTASQPAAVFFPAETMPVDYGVGGATRRIAGDQVYMPVTAGVIDTSGEISGHAEVGVLMDDAQGGKPTTILSYGVALVRFIGVPAPLVIGDVLSSAGPSAPFVGLAGKATLGTNLNPIGLSLEAVPATLGTRFWGFFNFVNRTHIGSAAFNQSNLYYAKTMT